MRLNLTLSLRYLQTSLALCFCFYFLIVAINNCLDYQSNLNFVEHVMAMDTTFASNRLKYRAVDSRYVHNFVFISLIAWEFFVGLMFAVGTFRMSKVLYKRGPAFHASKGLVLIAFNLSILLWFYAFIIVGSEWFLMWQSPQWNGKSEAFQLLAISLLAVMLLLRRESDDFMLPEDGAS